jgi:putative transposase
MPNHVHGIIEIVTKSVGAGSKPAPSSKSAPGCRPPCHNYGKGGEIELETGANLEESGLQTGAGLEPARTEPARKRLVDSMHAESKPNQQLKIKPLSEIVRQLKTFSARRVNQLRKTPGKPVWQRNYYEHVIRNEPAYCKISEYILNNPRSWPEDRYYSEQSFNP